MVSRDMFPSAVRAGQTLQGVVEGVPGRMSVVAAGTRIPLPESAPLTPGQAVIVEVGENVQGLQLRVTPVPLRDAPSLVQTPATPSASASTPLPILDMVGAILKALGSSLPRETAAQLLPSNVPPTEPVIRALLAQFVARASVGEDLARVAATLTQALAAGDVTEDAIREVLALRADQRPSTALEFEALVRRAADRSGARLEARIAEALASNDPQHVGPQLEEIFQNDLRAVLSRVQSNESLDAHLRQTGQAKTFHAAVDRVLDRLAGNQFQNVRGPDQPYWFVELPLAQGGPIQQAQLHVFEEKHGQGRAADAKSASVLLSLTTTRLGNLWIALQIADGACSCRFCATTPAAAQAIEDASGELAQAFEEAGYSSAAIHVALWDGDAPRETAALMRRFAGLNVKA